MNFTHESYLSPFTWRYGSAEMRQLWSLAEQRRVWRRIWVALAEVQQYAGLVTREQVEDLRQNMGEVDLERSQQIEAEVHHDLMAEVHTYAEQCKIGGGIIHLGATSMDIEDNADALRLRTSLDLIIGRLGGVLDLLAQRIDTEAGHVCMGFTHLQPAEPTTVGYRLAGYAQDWLEDFQTLVQLRDQIKGKGFKGAVGTSASYGQLLEGTGMSPAEMEARIMAEIGLQAFEVTHQTYPRRQDLKIIEALSSIAMTAYRFAFDLRLLQSPTIGEWAEPFASKQIGSSAMPFKRNPIHAENIDSLARYVATLPRVAWDNAAHHLLERTLDDSANRRIVLPNAFLAVDEILSRSRRILGNLRIDKTAIIRNLNTYGVFSATERVLMAAVRAGGDRQVLHEVIRDHSLMAWDALREGKPNPLRKSLSTEAMVTRYLTSERIYTLLDASGYVGDAPERAKRMVETIRAVLDQAGGR